MDRENILRKGILTTPGGNIFFRTAEIVSINPDIPQSWGTLIAGGHPQTPGRKNPAPIFQRSRYMYCKY
jgi:hypothetical protein